MGEALELTAENFDAEVEQSDVPVLVDFWGQACPPCRALAPIIEALASRYRGRAKIGKLNVGEHTSAAMRFGVRSIPTLILFKGGKPQRTMVGLQSEEDLTAALDDLLSA
jgi:thioredoxin 1